MITHVKHDTVVQEYVFLDAQFVDVIHSAGKWVGNDDLMGHVDFFPNLGRAPQPGCEDEESLDLSCSHFMVNKTKF